jgi:two-component system sensor histidine kinase FlrB
MCDLQGVRRSSKTALAVQTPPPTREALAEAFADFTRAAGLLEFSYRELQQEVAGLRKQLDDKNRHLAASLRENERMRGHLQNLLESLPCGVVLCGGTSRVQLCNGEAERLLQGVEDKDAIFAGLSPQPENEEREIVVRTGDQPRYLAVRPAAFTAHDGGAGALFIIRDATAEHHLEEEREHARRLQALAESSALLAHEVRNPLASMELFASLLVHAAPAGNNESRKWAKHIQAGLRMIAATVNNVLTLRNPGPLQLRAVNLPELLECTIQLLEPVAQQCGMRIDFDPYAKCVNIPGDPSRLQQVFFNLAVNAFRAMQPGGVLTVSVGPGTEDAAQVEFRDQGCGIAAEDLERIFEPGFTRGGGGAGFGLAVCRKIMDQHGGTLRVASRLGEGTTILLNFGGKGETE